MKFFLPSKNRYSRAASQNNLGWRCAHSHTGIRPEGLGFGRGDESAIDNFHVETAIDESAFQ